MVLALSVLLSFSFTGCSKKEPLQVDNEVQSVVDYSIAETEFLSIVAISLKHMNNTRSLHTFVQTPGCDSLKLVSGDTQWTSPSHIQPVFSIDLAAACSNNHTDGRNRSGPIRVSPNKPVSESGAVTNLRFQNVTSSNQLTCDSINIFTRSVSAAASVYRVVLYNGSVTQGTATVRYAFDRELEMDAAYNVKLTGNAAGTNRHGKTFSVWGNAVNPVSKQYHCKYVSAGRPELSPEGFKTRVVNFGNGDCDDQAFYEVNNNTVAFRLK